MLEIVVIVTVAFALAAFGVSLNVAATARDVKNSGPKLDSNSWEYLKFRHMPC